MYLSFLHPEDALRDAWLAGFDGAVWDGGKTAPRHWFSRALSVGFRRGRVYVNMLGVLSSYRVSGSCQAEGLGWVIRMVEVLSSESSKFCYRGFVGA